MTNHKICINRIIILTWIFNLNLFLDDEENHDDEKCGNKIKKIENPNLIFIRRKLKD